MLGASRRSRWAELTRGSVINGISARRAGPRRPRDLDERRRHDGERAAPAHPDAPAAAAAAPSARRAGCSPSSGCRCSRCCSPRSGTTLGFTSAACCYLLLVVVAGHRRRPLAGRSSPPWSAFALLNWFFTRPSTRSPSARARPRRPGRLPARGRRGQHAGRRRGAAAPAEASRARAEAEALAAHGRLAAPQGRPAPASCSTNLRGPVRARRTSPSCAPSPSVVVARPRPAPAPATGRRASSTLPLTAGVELRVHRRRPARGDDREVLSAFAAQLAVALETPAAAGGGGRAPRRWRRPTSCAPLLLGRVPRPAHAAGSIKASVTSLLQRDVVVHRRARRVSSRRSTRRPTGSTTSSATCST